MQAKAEKQKEQLLGKASLFWLEQPRKLRGKCRKMPGSDWLTKGMLATRGKLFTCKIWPSRKLARESRGLVLGSFGGVCSSGCSVFW